MDLLISRLTLVVVSQTSICFVRVLLTHEQITAVFLPSSLVSLMRYLENKVINFLFWAVRLFKPHQWKRTGLGGRNFFSNSELL